MIRYFKEATLRVILSSLRSANKDAILTLNKAINCVKSDLPVGAFVYLKDEKIREFFSKSKDLEHLYTCAISSLKMKDPSSQQLIQEMLSRLIKGK
jgi:hypothetical protein